MKRELSFPVDVRSQMDDSLGRIRDPTQVDGNVSNFIDVASPDGFCKRFKGSVVNGFIVYMRERKSRINLCNGFSENDESQKTISLDELENGRSSSLEEVKGIEEVETLAIYKHCRNLESSICETVLESTALKSPVRREPENAGVELADDEVATKDFPRKVVRRFTRSALRPELERTVSSPTKTETVEKDDILRMETALRPELELTGASPSKTETVEKEDIFSMETETTTPMYKVEMRIVKKSASSKSLMTVRELFETGFLEGVSVVYVGSGKGIDYGLRGTIRGGGILCTCTSCNGCKVIPPSKFEIHACKQYKRAAQYICLENGTSLLDLLKACRGNALHKLEATIRSVVNSSSEEKIFTCRRCKGRFPSSCLAQVGPLCTSCAESKKSEPILTPQTPPPSAPDRPWSPEPVKILKSPQRPPMRISSQSRSESMIKTKSPKRVMTSKSSQSATVHTRPQKWSSGKIKNRLSNPKSILKSSRSATKCITSQNKSQWKLTTKRDQRLHKLVFEESGLPEGTELAYFARGQKLLQGYKKGSGIFCCCCNCEVSPSQFEVHAGWSSRRKPYAYIYTSNGVSLHELAISLSKGRKYSANDNDDVCIICLDGGNLLLCDGCPRAFHKECASLASIPRGDWYCKFCQYMYQRDKFIEYNENAVAAGRTSGVDPIDDLSKRCIRIVKNIETELSGCVLCRGTDFSKSGFGPRTIILCDQCEKEFHVGCLKDHKMAFLKELPKGKWFCGTDCTSIHSALQKLLLRGEEKVPDSLCSVMNKKLVEKGLDTANDIDVRWQLISGKIASPETRPLLSEVVAIFHDCFDPIIDVTSGRDLIPAMVYGRDVGGQEFGGMYCAILIVNSSVVSAAMLRVFGQELAELPLVATSNANRGKGYFQILFSCIERLLAYLHVKNLVLPAAEEAESIWTDKFSFKRIKPEQTNLLPNGDIQRHVYAREDSSLMPTNQYIVYNSVDSLDRCTFLFGFHQSFIDYPFNWNDNMESHSSNSRTLTKNVFKIPII